MWDVHPAATCRGFLSFTKERKKKICNKRQSRVRLGAFIPQRKDRCAHCQSLGSYDRVSSKPGPGRVVVTMGHCFSDLGFLGPDMKRSVCGLHWVKFRRCSSFARTPRQSSPVVYLLEMFPDARRGQSWVVLVGVLGSPYAKAWACSPLEETYHQLRLEQAHLFALAPPGQHNDPGRLRPVGTRNLLP